jgi:hypothetical protein
MIDTSSSPAFGESGRGSFLGAPFRTAAAAERAAALLETAGYGRDEISVAADAVACKADFDEIGERIGAYTAVGAAGGGLVGALLGTAAVVAGFMFAGPIAIAAGAVTGFAGGALGAFLHAAGMPSHDAYHCEQEVAAGKILVGVHPHDGDAEHVRALLAEASVSETAP